MNTAAFSVSTVNTVMTKLAVDAAAEELAFRNKMDELLGQYNSSRQGLGLDELAHPDYDTLHVAPIKSPTTW